MKQSGTIGKNPSTMDFIGYCGTRDGSDRTALPKLPAVIHNDDLTYLPPILSFGGKTMSAYNLVKLNPIE